MSKYAGALLLGCALPAWANVNAGTTCWHSFSTKSGPILTPLTCTEAFVHGILANAAWVFFAACLAGLVLWGVVDAVKRRNAQAIR